MLWAGLGKAALRGRVHKGGQASGRGGCHLRGAQFCPQKEAAIAAQPASKAQGFGVIGRGGLGWLIWFHVVKYNQGQGADHGFALFQDSQKSTLMLMSAIISNGYNNYVIVKFITNDKRQYRG